MHSCSTVLWNSLKASFIIVKITQFFVNTPKNKKAQTQHSLFFVMDQERHACRVCQFNQVSDKAKNSVGANVSNGSKYSQHFAHNHQDMYKEITDLLGLNRAETHSTFGVLKLIHHGQSYQSIGEMLLGACVIKNALPFVLTDDEWFRRFIEHISKGDFKPLSRHRLSSVLFLLLLLLLCELVAHIWFGCTNRL